MMHLLDKLNPPQREAATYLGGPLMIIAGAGSGKTRVITHRIAFLASEVGIPLHDILAVTFTNKAAREMRERVFRILGRDDMPSLPIGTFHSRCAMILRRDADAAGLDQNFTILDEKDQVAAVKRAMERCDVSEKRVKPAQVHNFINTAKMRLLTPEDCAREFAAERIPYADLYAAYEDLLKRAKALDIEDLIFKTVLLFQRDDDARRHWARRYQHVLVDEYQDTNHGQFLLTKLLAQDHGNICVVGDEDQAIYSWRGADITNLLDFEKSFPGVRVVKLEQNYRSTANILRGASVVIARNTQRLGKTLFTEGAEGDPLEYLRGEDDRHEGWLVAQEVDRLLRTQGVPASEVAVFYRSHRLSRPVEDALRGFQIPYRIVGGVRFYDRAEVKDVLCFLRLAVNPNDDLAFERVVNVPKRGIGDKAQQSLREQAQQDRTSLYEAAWRAIKADGPLASKARGNLAQFLVAIEEWHREERHLSPRELLELVYTHTRYKEEGLGDTTSIDGEARLENLQEFEAVVELFRAESDRNRTAEFLRTLSLDAAVADRDEGAESVSLMSVHNAKGLEFDHVFVVGLEEGVFPNSRAMGDLSETGVEEERRLYYVALTRARKRLCLSRAGRRMGYSGGYDFSEPSRFLAEMPPEVFAKASFEMLRRELKFGWGEERTEPASKAGPERKFAQLVAQGAAGLRAAATDTEFRRGDRVVHRYLGAGEVFNIAGRPGAQKIHIRFDDGREQAFVARQAPIVREGEG
ncbi:MAG: UvrD-helicase domain-containing protein [Candidatus Sumerlaeia bacterium]|nr:UvrD-helicase domain-containing protein [Candidatus Sumerlaeia bacterium]